MRLPDICISDIENRVRATKAKNTMMHYVAMLSQLRNYVGGDVLALDNVDSCFVKGFGNSMLAANLTPKTVLLYKNALRAVLKPEFGAENRAKLKSAFEGHDSHCIVATKTATFEDVLAIYGYSGASMFRQVRDIFMFAFYGGGMTLDEVKSSVDGKKLLLPQQNEIVRKFSLRYPVDFLTCVRRITENEYNEKLGVIASELRLSHNITSTSAADCWIDVARRVEIPVNVIALAVRQKTGFLEIVDATVASEREINDALMTVACRIYDPSVNWYVMRCFDETLDVVGERLKTDVALLDGDDIETFVAPVGSAKIKTNVDAYMSKLLFFRCSADNAALLSRELRPKCYVYPCAGGNKPAMIPRNSMRLFMLFSEVPSNNICYYFPEELAGLPEFKNEDRVTVLDGTFMGQEGIVVRQSKDSLKVYIKIPVTNGYMEAEVNKEFLSVVESACE